MSQVDDWADGYADSARDVNLYGPASANVPRSSVVSHQVRYRAPDTSDIPLAPGQNPEGSVYSNASSARMGQTKPASGYRAPAGGGWDVNSSDANLRFPNESGGRRYARSKTKASAKPARKRTQKPAAPAKSAATDYGSYKDLSDPLSQHILANGSPEPKPPVESVASVARDVTDQSDIYRAIGRLSSPPSANDSQSEVRTAGGINPFESDESLAAWKALKLKSFPILPSEMSGGVPDASVTRFRQIAGDPNSTVADVLSAENEAKRAAIDEGMTMDNIAAFEKEVALNLLFAGAGSALNALRGAGGAARAASSTGNVWVEGSRAAAGDATAGAKAFEEALSRMNGGAVRGAPVEGTARSSFSSAGTTTGTEAAAEAAAEGRRLYGPVAERLLAPKGSLTGGARTTLTSADEGLPVGYSMLRNPKIDTSPLAGQTSNLVAQLRAAGIPEDQIAASIARINAGAAGREAAAAGREAATAGREAAAAGGQAAGREAAAGGQAAGREAATAGEAAADGGVSELANAGNAGRETAAGAATGSVSEGVDLASQQLIQHIRSGTLDEVERAWIEAMAAGAAKAPGTVNASTQAILNEARAAGILGRDAAGTAGANGAAGAARGVP